MSAFAPGAEGKLDRVTRSSRNQVDQMIDVGYELLWAEIFNQQVIAWRPRTARAADCSRCC